MASTRTRRTRILTFAMVGLAVVSGGTGMFSLALFTDSATVSGNQFTTGAVDISASPASAAVSLTGMMPGDTVNGTLTVSNAATAGQLRYAMTTSATNADSKGLKDQLTLTVRTRDVATDTCTSFDGTQLYSGALGSAALGSTTAGAQTGDRALNASASEKLCMRVTLPSSTGNAFQGATTTATFTFEAEQTANNP